MQIKKLLEEQEKVFYDKFCWKPYVKIDEFNVVPGGDKYLASELPGEIVNWHKQSLKQFIDGLVEETDKMIVNRPEKLITLNAHLDSTTRDNSYNNAVGYCQAVDKFVSHLKEIRAKLV